MQMQDVTFTFRLDKETKAKFAETTKRNGTTTSFALRQLIYQYLRENANVSQRKDT